jgi:hypothetical protein
MFPVVYRLSVSVRVIAVLFGPVIGLGGAFLMVAGVVQLADPAPFGSRGVASHIFSSLIGIFGGAGIALLGLRMTRTAIVECLTVASDGLICRVAGWWFSVRTKEILWSSVTSITAEPSGKGYCVYVTLDSGQREDLPTTYGSGKAAARIAEELTRALHEHRADSRPGA